MTEHLYVNVLARPDAGGVVRRASFLLLLYFLTASLLAGCLDADQTVGSVGASASAAPGGSAAAARADASGVPEATAGVASGIEGDLAGAAEASSGTPFFASAEAQVTTRTPCSRFATGYERAVIDLGTGWEPAGTVPAWTLASHRDREHPRRLIRRCRDPRPGKIE